MPNTNKEDLITTEFVKILRPMLRAWTLNQHPSKPLLENDKEPDVIVTEPKRAPLAIEVKIDKQRGADVSGEKQLRDFYLGKTLKQTGEKIHTGIVIRFPYEFRRMEQAAIETEVARTVKIAYCLLSEDEPTRFPKAGWLMGTVADIAAAIRIGAVPISKIEEVVQVLKDGVNHAAARAEITIEERPDIGKRTADILVQEPGKQTTQMAMLIIGNAFVFQSLLARKPDLETVPSLSELTEEYGHLSVAEVLQAWEDIREINYTPIFGVADRLVRVLRGDDRLAGDVLRILRETAFTLERMGLAQEHELAGIAFQEFIAERKIIKANYTRPESAALLCALVLPADCGFSRGSNQFSGTGLTVLPKVADFACGTGTLLNGMYQRILAFHELSGGEGEDIHQRMVENNLLGCDIVPNATHLTVAIIAGTHPHIKIGDTRIKTMPYGTPHGDGRYAIGALDLLSNPEETMALNLESAEVVSGHGHRAEAFQQQFRHAEFDFVVQNPPFTVAGADNNSGVPKTIFGDKEARAAMSESLKAQKSEIGHGKAGLGSYFLELADKMLKPGGKMGFVLPETALAGVCWKKARNLLAREYHDVIVVTVADAKAENFAFSADTNMAECLLIATKGKSANTGRGCFVCLHRRPNSELEAREIAKQIHQTRDIRQLEAGPLGGNAIEVGTESVGYAIDASLIQADFAWPVSRVKDMVVVQSAHQLANGKLWLPRQGTPLPLPIRPLSEIARTGLTHGNMKRAFDLKEGCPETADYPCLWHCDAAAQTTMVVAPDSHAQPRPDAGSKVQGILELNSRTHYNEYLRFNTNALAVMFTEQKSIGVNLLPNVVFPDPLHEYAWTLWGNSTLGILCYWLRSGKQHDGRGILSRSALKSMSTLDVRQLNPLQLAAAERIFHELKHEEMRPFHKIAEDPARQKLDRLLLSVVLGFTEEKHPEVHEGIDLLRKKLCAEPSIHGGR